MNQRAVFIAGFIGLLFGFLLTATLGFSFFEDEPNTNNNDNNPTSELKKDEESFRVAYNLTDSIYIPISGDDVYDMITLEDTFIVYAGRDTCPYCQAYVPVLMDAAESLGIDTIYHIDTTDPLNTDYIADVGVPQTPTTFIYVDGVLVETIHGYETEQDTIGILDMYLTN